MGQPDEERGSTKIARAHLVLGLGGVVEAVLAEEGVEDGGDLVQASPGRPRQRLGEGEAVESVEERGEPPGPLVPRAGACFDQLSGVR